MNTTTILDLYDQALDEHEPGAFLRDAIRQGLELSVDRDPDELVYLTARGAARLGQSVALPTSWADEDWAMTEPVRWDRRQQCYLELFPEGSGVEWGGR